MSNLQTTVYPSAARTATPTARTLAGHLQTWHSTLRLVVNVTAVTATPSVTVTVDVFNQVSGTWVNVFTSAAITAVGSYALAPVAGLVGRSGANVRVTVTHADADSITYSVAAHLTE